MTHRLFAVILALAALPLSAAVFIVPPDSELIDEADAIVVGTVRTLHPEFITGGNIATMIEIEVETALKGPLRDGERIRVQELGGVIGEQSMGVSGAPGYWTSNRALIFLQNIPSGGMRTWGAVLGKFDFVKDESGRELTLRWLASEDHVSLWTPEGTPGELLLRDAELFIRYIRLRVSGRLKRRGVVHDEEAVAQADYFVDIPLDRVSEPAGWRTRSLQTSYPPSAYSYFNYRWNVFDTGGSVTFHVSGSQPGYDYLGAAQRGLAAWTNESGSNISYVYGGTRSASFADDNTNAIIFNNSTDVPSGAVAYAQWYGGAYHTYKGEQFITITEGDVVVRAGLTVSQQVFDEALTHELGHTLGFRHSDQGTPSSTQAVMKAVLSGQFGAALGPWDIDAARTVYTGSSTTPPPGNPANLVATATSTTSIQITWGAGTNATQYELERSTNIANGFIRVGTFTTRSYTDSGRAPNTTYVYRVRATGVGGASGYSNMDHATTVIFTDEPLVPRVTTIRALHLAQIRTAVNAVRAAAGLGAASFTDAATGGVTMKAVHVTQLRTALSAALTALGKTASFTDPSLARGNLVRASHFQELRNATK